MINLAFPAWNSAAITTEGNFCMILLRYVETEGGSQVTLTCCARKFQATRTTLQGPNSNFAS